MAMPEAQTFVLGISEAIYGNSTRLLSVLLTLTGGKAFLSLPVGLDAALDICRRLIR